MFYFTGDEHYYHSKIIEYNDRPFVDVHEMNEMQIENHNSVITKRDTVVHVGDFTLRNRSFAEKIIKQLNGNHIFLYGSHDYWMRKSERRWVWTKTIDGQYIVVCHYAFRSWPKSFHGSWNLHGHCFDFSTELLTNIGFLRFEDIISSESIMALTLNLSSLNLEYKPVSDVFVFPYIGNMCSFECKSGEILVTPEHTMLSHSPSSGEIIKTKAQDALDIRNFILPINANSNGIEYNIEPEFFRLLGLIISEGHFHKEEGKNSSNGVSIYQKSSNISFIETTLNKLNTPFNKHTRRIKDVDITTFYIPANWVKSNIYRWIVAKRISNKLMSIRGKQFLYFLSGLIFGDGQASVGSYYKKTDLYNSSKLAKCLALPSTGLNSKVQYIYYTSDIVLRDQLMHLCTLNGLKAKHSYSVGGFSDGCWAISIKDKNYLHFKDSRRPKKFLYKKTVPYLGYVWCVSTENETLVLRRNGFIFITGNSHGRLKPIGKQWDVGVDNNNYFPVSFPQIRKIMRKAGKNTD